ncbi:MAG: VCBS repeat-containing protein [Propionivibrio sp.]
MCIGNSKNAFPFCSLLMFCVLAPSVLAAECQWLVSSGGNANFQNFAKGQSIENLRFGDFDGDGKTDVFFTTPVEGSNNQQWQFSSGGNGAFTKLRIGPPLAKLGFGDFDGDGKTDVFIIEPHSLGLSLMQFSSGGVAGFEDLRTVRSDLAEDIFFLRFGDFDGDRTTDVFTWIPGNMIVQYVMSSGGRSEFKNLARGRVPVGFGDFDGDMKTDVFVIGQVVEGGAQWMFSPGGAGEFRKLAVGPGTKPAFGDFDADGKTDVFRTEDLKNGTHQWMFSSGGTDAFQNLGVDGPLFAGSQMMLAFGDFDGDRRADGFATDCR